MAQPWIMIPCRLPTFRWLLSRQAKTWTWCRQLQGARGMRWRRAINNALTEAYIQIICGVGVVQLIEQFPTGISTWKFPTKISSLSGDSCSLGHMPVYVCVRVKNSSSRQRADLKSRLSLTLAHSPWVPGWRGLGPPVLLPARWRAATYLSYSERQRSA